MSEHDVDWWMRRAIRRYRETQRLRTRIEAALAAHADCWPDDPCSELAHDIRAVLEEKK